MSEKLDTNTINECIKLAEEFMDSYKNEYQYVDYVCAIRLFIDQLESLNERNQYDKR